MSNVPSTKTEIIKTLTYERVKSKVFYNVNNQATHIYTAGVDTPDQGHCLGTKYEYDGVSQRVTAWIEFDALWDATWEVATPYTS